MLSSDHSYSNCQWHCVCWHQCNGRPHPVSAYSPLLLFVMVNFKFTRERMPRSFSCNDGAIEPTLMQMQMLYVVYLLLMSFVTSVKIRPHPPTYYWEIPSYRHLMSSTNASSIILNPNVPLSFLVPAAGNELEISRYIYTATLGVRTMSEATTMEY